MKLIIAGSRDINKYRALYAFLLWLRDNNPLSAEIEEFVTGDCKTGPDQVPYLFTEIHRLPIKAFPANWDDTEHPDALVRTRPDGSQYNAKAGPIRNRQMAEFADRLLLIWDGKSKGSKNMKAEMKRLGKEVHEIIIDD